MPPIQCDPPARGRSVMSRTVVVLSPPPRRPGSGENGSVVQPNPLPAWLPGPVRAVLTPAVRAWLSRGLLAGLRGVLLAIGTLSTNIPLFVLFVVSVDSVPIARDRKSRRLNSR